MKWILLIGGLWVVSWAAQADECFMEAELGKLEGDAVVMQDRYASAEKCVDIGEKGSGTVMLNFELKESGRHYLLTRLHQLPSDAPLAVTLDGAEIKDACKPYVKGNWTWARGEMPADLKAGKHTLVFQGKDCLIDKVKITRLTPFLVDCEAWFDLGAYTSEADIAMLATAPRLDTAAIFGAEAGTCWLATEITCPKNEEAQVWTDTHGKTRIWLNGKLVCERVSWDKEGPDRKSYFLHEFEDCSLKAGKNTVMIEEEIRKCGRGYTLALMFVRKGGGFIKGMHFSNGIGGRPAVSYPAFSAKGPIASGEVPTKIGGEGWKALTAPQMGYTPEAQKVCALYLTGKAGADDLLPHEKKLRFEPFDPKFQVTQPQKSFYVSPGGDDSAQGTRGKPWKTLAAANRLKPGEELVLLAGTYKGSIEITCRGAADGWVTIRADKGRVPYEGSVTFGNRAGYVRLCGLDIDAKGESQALIFKRFCHDLLVENCTLTKGGREAMVFEGGRYIHLRNLHVFENGDGLQIGRKGQYGARGVLFDHLLLERNGGGGNRDGIIAEGFCSALHIVKCYSTGHGDSGFDIKPGFSHIAECASIDNRINAYKLWRGGDVVTDCIYNSGRISLGIPDHFYTLKNLRKGDGATLRKELEGILAKGK